ncbi:MAG: hypothetical protein U0556_11420 [Dehalococcoidia bacterium]
MPLVLSIDGPILSTADLAEQQAILGDVFGLKSVAEERLDARQVAQRWGLTGHTAQTVLLETPGTSVGVLVVQFDPVSPIVIREGVAPYDGDALKVIDFYGLDVPRTVELLEAHGLHLKEEIATYEVPGEGEVSEAHIWGPDQVVYAVLTGPPGFAARMNYTRVNDRLISEISSFSSPVFDKPAVFAFYQDVLGLEQTFHYEIEHESFQGLVGMDQRTRVTGDNFGWRVAPQFGIIHYGLPEGVARSLRDRAVLPNRGLVGARLTTTSAQEVEWRCRSAEIEVLAPADEIEIAPYGRVRSLTVRAPHGVVHQLIER